MPLFFFLCNFIIFKLDWFRIALDDLLQLSSYEILMVSRNKFGDRLMLGLVKLKLNLNLIGIDTRYKISKTM